MNDDVVVNDTGSVEGTGNDARVAMLNQIADQNDVGGADDLQNINDDGTTEAFAFQHSDGENEPLKDEIVPDADAAEAIDNLAQEVDEEERFTVKVNGKEMQLTRDELIARAQKVESADQYLAEAARLRNEQATKAKPSVQDAEPQVQADDDLAIIRAIQMGTEEEAVAALRTLRNSQKSLSTDDISRTIDERLTFNEAIGKFRAEYSDIANDPYLNKLALETDAQLLANGDRRSYYERYQEIGESLRGWAKGVAKRYAPEQAVASPQADKVNRKAAAPAVPKGQSQKTATSVEEEREESTSDVIANIAKSRGGPQWMNSTRH